MERAQRKNEWLTMADLYGKEEEAMAKKPLFVLIGKSGSGKDTVVDLLADIGWKRVSSYTTRPMRAGEQNGREHTFLSNSEYDQIKPEDIVAQTLFAGNRYCATKQQLDGADIYIVDKKGLEDVRKNYSGPMLAIYLDSSDKTRRERMARRGDVPEQIENRLKNDRKVFQGVEEMCDIIINVDSLSPKALAGELIMIAQNVGKCCHE